MSVLLTDEILAKSSKQRLMEAANFTRSTFLILTEDDEATGLKANAVLERVQDYYVAPYTARAIFTIDRFAQGIPFGETAPKVRYLTRKINISRINANTIVKKFGFGNVLYLGVGEVPETTKELAPYFEERFGLIVTEEDIIDQTIVEGSNCIILRFAPSSLAYEGALRVDLTTKVDGVA